MIEICEILEDVGFTTDLKMESARIYAAEMKLKDMVNRHIKKHGQSEFLYQDYEGEKLNKQKSSDALTSGQSPTTIGKKKTLKAQL